jgi:hypothetical protein
MQVTRHDSRRVTPFGHPGITARLTTPPGLSRPPTSFIGPWCPGIHRPPLPTYPTHTYPDEQQTPQQHTNKMLASTMQISTHHQPTTTPPPQRHGRAWPRQHPRSHQHRTVVLSEPQQGAHHRTRPSRTGLSPPPPLGDGRTRPTRPPPDRLASASTPHHTPRPPTRAAGPHRPPPGPAHTDVPRAKETSLLRKEVIQPHLPVRLPCYDFVPIASPTFDHSPPSGLGHGLRVLPTFVT